jgi:hypothetical protein
VRPAIDRLPVRSRPFQGESLRGYVLRLSLLNGVPPGSRFSAVTGERIPYRNEEFPLDRLAYLVGMSSQELESLIEFRGRRNWRDRYYEFGRLRWRIFQHPSLTCRFCPVCLAENAFLHSGWEVALWGCCTRHGLLLETVCPGCQKRPRWARQSVAHCQCGTALTMAKPIPADPDALRAQGCMERLVAITAKTGGTETTDESGSDPGLRIGRAILRAAYGMGDAVAPVWPQQAENSLRLLWMSMPAELRMTSAVLQEWRANAPCG